MHRLLSTSNVAAARVLPPRGQPLRPLRLPLQYQRRHRRLGALPLFNLAHSGSIFQGQANFIDRPFVNFGWNRFSSSLAELDRLEKTIEEQERFQEQSERQQEQRKPELQNEVTTVNGMAIDDRHKTPKQPPRRPIPKARQKTAKDTDLAELQVQMEQLFDEIAPMVIVLHTFLDQLKKRSKNPRERQKFADKIAFKATNDQKKNRDVDATLWMQCQVLSFLGIFSLQSPPRPLTSVASPADRSKVQLENAALILQQARNKVVQSGNLWWCNQKKPRAKPAQKRRHAQLRKARHESKSEAELEQEAMELAATLAQRLPPSKFQEFLHEFLQSYVNSSTDSSENNDDDNDDDESVKDATTEGKPTKTVGVRHLFNHIDRKVGRHVHLVSKELAEFFYFDRDPVGAGKRTSSELSSSGHVDSQAWKHPKILETQQQWDTAKQQFVRKLMSIFKIIYNVPGQEQGAGDVKKQGEMAEERGEELLSEIMEIEEFRKAKKNRVPRGWRSVHLLFDATVVPQHHGPEVGEEDSRMVPLSADTTVFIDNLPIDITEAQISELYSRCGDVESVEIFNQRPDLDPGPLSFAKHRELALIMQKRRRSQRYDGRRGAGHRDWKRPRSPVYGIISFSDVEGSQTTVQDSLRIFGMIVNGHAVRSYRARDMTCLYLDGILPIAPDSAEAATKKDLRSFVDIERRLSQLLNPEIYVSLDISGSGGERATWNRCVPRSCEVKFPSFEAAYKSFVKLQHELDLLKEDDFCTLNWMQTPADAMLYWKRKTGGSL